MIFRLPIFFMPFCVTHSWFLALSLAWVVSPLLLHTPFQFSKFCQIDWLTVDILTACLMQINSVYIETYIYIYIYIYIYTYISLFLMCHECLHKGIQFVALCIWNIAVGIPSPSSIRVLANVIAWVANVHQAPDHHHPPLWLQAVCSDCRCKILNWFEDFQWYRMGWQCQRSGLELAA